MTKLYSMNYKNYTINLFQNKRTFAVDISNIHGMVIDGWNNYKRAGNAVHDAKKYIDVMGNG